MSVVSDDDDVSLTRRKSSTITKCFVNHDYHDHAFERESEEFSDTTSEDQSEHEQVRRHSKKHSKQRKGPRGGVAVPFPEKLHTMLTNVQNDGYEDIVSWQPHGRCFQVHKPKEFVAQVMPRYFKQTKLTSFQRQLNLYGFHRLTAGEDRGGYYHELFLRGRPFLCRHMIRTRIKGTGIKGTNNPRAEPNFYKLPFVKPLNETAQADSVESSEAQHEDAPNEVTSSEEMSSLGSVPMLAPSPAFPLVMPVFPQSIDSTQELIKSFMPPPSNVPVLVSPAHSPLHAVLPQPSKTPSNWLLSDSIEEEEDEVMFEGKTFHYLDPSSFEDAVAHEDRGFQAEAWGMGLDEGSEQYFERVMSSYM